MMSLTLRDMLHVIFISLVAYLAVGMVFVRYRLKLLNLIDSEVMVCFKMLLLIFSCFSLTSPLDPDKVIYGELLLGP